MQAVLLEPPAIAVYAVERARFPIHDLRRKENTIVNIRRQAHCTQKAIDLLAANKINPDTMVTHHFSLAETQLAFDLVALYRDGVMKTMIAVD